MKIAIIGAGNVGRAVARGVTRAGHSVSIAAAHPDHAEALASDVGGAAASDAAEAARDADVVVLAVPYAAAGDVARALGDTARGKVVVDTTNPVRADGSGLAVTGRSAAEEIRDQISGARVVKAFNTVFAANQADPVTDGTPLDGFYAGDDEEAKATVRGILADLGYRPIDAGPLSAALALEHLAFLNIALNIRHGWPWQSGWKLVGPTG
jgi:8-hydroxy-5-deazaflavin:NADPH oxidoreductase